jgi:CheY-like chemotaxis protein
MSNKVLLVDDMLMFLEIQKGFLKPTTIHIQCAQDGIEALTLVKLDIPDLVIMDLHMPKMDGAECCRAIKGDPRSGSIPVVMTTSAGKTEDHEICRRAGCDFLLTKPFERNLYLDTVRRYIPELDRREKRIPVKVRARFQAFRVNMTGTILDLSVRGGFLATDFKLDEGVEVLLAFSLPEDGTIQIQAKGVVRWTNGDTVKKKSDYPQGFGLEFTAFSQGSFAALQQYLLQRGL